MRRVGGLRVAALVSAMAAVGILVWLYGADIAYVLGLVPTTNPYKSAFADAPSQPPDPREQPARAVIATSGPIPKSQRMSPSAVGGIPKGRRLVIPRLGVNVGVAGGDPERALSKGTYHHAGTADPGAGDNVVLAGHRNLGVFSLLYRLRAGDPIILYWAGKEHDYRVSKVFDVGPTDTRILEQSGQERLTLYTCRPREMGDKRTVVVALPVAP